MNTKHGWSIHQALCHNAKESLLPIRRFGLAHVRLFFGLSTHLPGLESSLQVTFSPLPAKVGPRSCGAILLSGILRIDNPVVHVSIPP